MKKYFTIRRIVALLFILFFAVVGVKFYFFVRFYENGGQGFFFSRPPSVEGFLPISAVMAFRQWVTLGIWDNIHPAGLTIFIAIVLTAFLFRRFFCSFICPVGTISDWLHIAGKKVFKKSFQPPKWLDIALGGLKYLLLAFFIYFVFAAMDIANVSSFLQMDYNKVADVKMLYFFLKISGTTFVILAVLAAASLFIPFFWCRYLCPYGALLAILSKFSPAKVKRNPDTCINCKKCDAACPVGINISSENTVTNSSCTACLSCVEVCPKANTLEMTFFNRYLQVKIFAALALGIFFLVILAAMLSGHWQTFLTPADWQQLIPNARSLSH